MEYRKVFYLQISFLIVCYFVEFLLLCIKQQGFFLCLLEIVVCRKYYFILQYMNR
jgi:hypothetical protein